jgi:hypothetical protein
MTTRIIHNFFFMIFLKNRIARIILVGVAVVGAFAFLFKIYSFPPQVVNAVGTVLQADDIITKGPWVDPRAFGATGDGSTDDTVALQTAINNAYNKILYIPPGNYKITAPLSISNNIVIEGSGEAATLITVSGNIVGINLALTENNKSVRIQGLTVYLGTRGIQHTSGYYLSRFSSFRDLGLAGQTEAGLYLTSGLIGTQHSNINCENTGNYGLYIEGDSIANASVWTGFRGVSTREAAVYIKETGVQDQPAITFINPILESNSKHGLYTYSSRVLLINSWFENNGSAGNGAATRYPDILMDGNRSNRNHVDLEGGYFSSGNANQSNLRIALNSTAQTLTVKNTRFLGGQVIDGNNNNAASRIVFFGELTNRPTVINFNAYAGYEFNGLLFPGGTQIIGHVSATASLPLGNITAKTVSSQSMTVPGAAVGDVVYAAPLADPGTGLIWSAFVSGPDTVLIRIANSTNNPIAGRPVSWRADVWKH